MIRINERFRNGSDIKFLFKYFLSGKKKGRNTGSTEGEWDEDPVKETATTGKGHIGKHIREMWTDKKNLDNMHSTGLKRII